MPNRRRGFRLFAASLAAQAALLLWLAVGVAANAPVVAVAAGPAPYALIFGTVWSPGGHPVYGIHVMLRRAGEKKFRWEAWSDHRGEFGIRVPAGRGEYILVPEQKHAGNPPETRIQVEGDERIDIGVHLAQEQNAQQ
jgi:hypothetical protein